MAGVATPMEMEGPDVAAATAFKDEGAALYKRAEYKAAVAAYTSGLAKLADGEARMRALKGEDLALCVARPPPTPCALGVPLWGAAPRCPVALA